MTEWFNTIKVLERPEIHTELEPESDDDFEDFTSDPTIQGPDTGDDADTGLGEKNKKGNHCKCEGKKCKFEAKWKCRNCGSQKCTLHKNRAESYRVGKRRTRSSHIHRFRPWECDPKDASAEGTYK